MAEARKPEELTLPASVSACVLIRMGDGEFEATYLEARSRVPLPKADAARLLFELALDLAEQARQQGDDEDVDGG